MAKTLDDHRPAKKARTYRGARQWRRRQRQPVRNAQDICSRSSLILAVVGGGQDEDRSRRRTIAYHYYYYYILYCTRLRPDGKR